MDSYAVPKVHPPRRIAHGLKPKVKEDLDWMVREKVITNVETSNAWVYQIVVVEKPNGKVRICLDPRDLNH